MPYSHTQYLEDQKRIQEERRQAAAARRQADQQRLQASRASSFNPGQTGLAATQITPGSAEQRQLLGERARQSLSQWGADGDGRWSGWKAPEPPPQPEPQKPADFYEQLINRLGPDMVRQGINMLGAYAPWMFR